MGTGLVSMTKRGPRAMAFTLIELLVVTSLLAMVIGAIGAALAGGIRVWDSARTFNSVEAEVYLAFRIMRKDIANAPLLRDSPFRGEPDGFVVSGLVRRADPETGEGGATRLGSISYRFDVAERTWTRTLSALPLDPAGDAEPWVETLVRDLGDVTLSYAGQPESDAPPVWSDTWLDPTNTPLAVRVEIVTGAQRPMAFSQVFLCESMADGMGDHEP